MSKSIDVLAAAFEAAKLNEDKARAERIRIEEQICEFISPPLEGSNRVDSDAYRITVTQPIRRTIDEAKLREVAHMIPDSVGGKVIRWKPDLVLKEFRAVQQFLPEVYSVLSSAVTAKPGKPSIKVERIDQEVA